MRAKFSTFAITEGEVVDIDDDETVINVMPYGDDFQVLLMKIIPEEVEPPVLVEEA